MTELERKKKLLVAEAEVYRETLKLEIYNLRIYGINAKRKLSSFSPRSNPLVMMSLPMLGSLLTRKRGFSWKGIGGLALLALQLYGRFGSLFGSSPAKSSIGRSEAEEYLSRAI